ncbi:MAG: O-antigen ligase family protein [Planctomycetota bacterium]|jgi:hypothetical protein
MIKSTHITTFLMFSLLFVCVTTSNTWLPYPAAAQGEMLRFDKIKLFGEAEIYHLFAALFFLILFCVKFGPAARGTILGDRNYLKDIFLLYFIAVNALMYFTMQVKNIELQGVGVGPFLPFFVFLTVVFFVQDIFLRNKNSRQLGNILTALEVLILLRCFYTIVKYTLSLGIESPFGGGARMGAEDDFADLFILLFTMALVRLLFDKGAGVRLRLLHISAIVSSSCVGVISFRRYFWAQLLAATGIILLFHWRRNRVNFNKKAAILCCLMALILGSILVVGTDKAVDNRYVGRLLTVLTLVNPQFASRHGTDTGHRAEIADGWHNVRRNILLGITPFGGAQIERFETAAWQSGLFVHNAYLQVWLLYGLLGFVLFAMLYLKSLRLGYTLFHELKDPLGLILIAFLLCQMLKNIVWPTSIVFVNVTIVYIFLISIALRVSRQST